LTLLASPAEGTQLNIAHRSPTDPAQRARQRRPPPSPQAEPTAKVLYDRHKRTRRRLGSYGDIIFYTYPGQSVPHHVVIYLGGDRILQAPETGQNVGYGTLSEFPGQTATVRRVTEP